MPEVLLWDLTETARQLGGVSVRTVRRLIERGELKAMQAWNHKALFDQHVKRAGRAST